MSKRNYNQKLSKKNWKVIIVAVVLGIVASALAFNLTDGYDNLDFKDNLTLKLNEDNFFFEKIEDGEIYDNTSIDAVAKNGVITLNGKIVDTDPGAITLSDSIDLGTVTLPAGEYTFTCFNSPSYKGYYAVGTYTLDGATYTWYADFDKAPNNTTNSTLLQGKTIELPEEVEVNFEIRLVEGVELKNVKACPVVVEGDENGNYYKGFFK